MSEAKKDAAKPAVVATHAAPLLSSDWGYALVFISAPVCDACGRHMWSKRMDQSPICPAYYKGWLTEQLKRGGAVEVSGQLRQKARGDYKPLCVDCARVGEATFVCALCGETRPWEQSQEDFGGPAEHLCTPCYETVPAKKWDDYVRKLSEAHEYDYC